MISMHSITFWASQNMIMKDDGHGSLVGSRFLETTTVAIISCSPLFLVGSTYAHQAVCLLLFE